MFFRILCCAALLAVASPASAEAPSAPATNPEAFVRAYTDAANAGDIDRFLGLYDPTIRKFRFPGQMTSEGVEHNRRVYEKSFAANPDLHVEIVALIRLGDKVMVRDRVTGLANGGTADELTVYQIEGGRITNILYVERIPG